MRTLGEGARRGSAAQQPACKAPGAAAATADGPGQDLRPGLLPAVVTSVGVPRSPRTSALHASSLQTGMRRMPLGDSGPADEYSDPGGLEFEFPKFQDRCVWNFVFGSSLETSVWAYFCVLTEQQISTVEEASAPARNLLLCSPGSSEGRGKFPLQNCTGLSCCSEERRDYGEEGTCNIAPKTKSYVHGHFLKSVKDLAARSSPIAPLQHGQKPIGHAVKSVNASTRGCPCPTGSCGGTHACPGQDSGTCILVGKTWGEALLLAAGGCFDRQKKGNGTDSSPCTASTGLACPRGLKTWLKGKRRFPITARSPDLLFAWKLLQGAQGRRRKQANKQAPAAPNPPKSLVSTEQSGSPPAASSWHRLRLCSRAPDPSCAEGTHRSSGRKGHYYGFPSVSTK
ncbi:hypothetical protein Anapl_02399 [Anas platyrhynchos]|uniref:Uncharacterized protein n=1 Tax=Anas platyrhynchos TaxID=8839 RepID=R0LPR1_ANAPL|nr:hypothetical protein Anapl_02399 [Anas platyrhynchos]